MSSSLRLLSISVIALLAAACNAAGAGPTIAPSGSSEPSGSEAAPASPSATGIAYPTGATDIVLRIRDAGGLVPDPHVPSVEYPFISVYGDGTVIVLGPQVEIYPGPALPNLNRATISPAGMQILLEAARGAGLLGPDEGYGLPGIPADASSTQFTVNADGRIHTVSAYALMMGGGRPQDNGPAVTAARAALASFETQMGNLDALLGPELGSWASYEANAVQLLVRRGTPDDGYRIARQPIARQPIAWPLSTPLADFGSVLGDLRCGVVSGSDLDLLMPLLKTANTLTPWTDGGASFGIWFRQELPGDPRFAFCPLVSR